MEATGGRLIPEWLESDLEALKGTVKELPSRDAIDVPVDEMLMLVIYDLTCFSSGSRHSQTEYHVVKSALQNL